MATKPNNSFKVICYNPQGDIAHVYDSLDDACRKTHLKRTFIQKSFTYAAHRSVNGFIWRKQDQAFNEPLWQYRKRQKSFNLTK